MHQSWSVDLGIMMSEPAIRFENMGRERPWGCACWIVDPYALTRGGELRPAYRTEIRGW